jgi:RecA-family ATPase
MLTRAQIIADDARVIALDDEAERGITADIFKNRPVPERREVVSQLIPDRTVTLLTGDGGTGKTLLALQLAASGVSGRDWLDLPVKAGRSLFLSAEDDRDELHRRLDAIVENLQIGWDDVAGLRILPLAGKDAVLAQFSSRIGQVRPTPLFDRLEGIAADWRPATIILDSLHDVFVGEENDRCHARQFINLLRGLALKYECAVILLSHPSLSGMASGSGTSGSTAWNNAVRSRLYLTREKADDGAEVDSDVRVLQTMKANYSRIGNKVRVRWVDGVFVPDVPAAGAIGQTANLCRARDTFLTLLDAYTAEQRHVSATPSPSYAPAIFARDGRSSGMRKPELQAAMNLLFADGSIRVDEFGPPSKRRSRIVRA